MKIKPKHILWTFLALLTGGIAIVAILIYGALSAFDIPGPDDIPLDKKTALELTNSFIEYERIYSMDDATRCYKHLNGDPLSLSGFSDSDDDVCDGKRLSLDSLLKNIKLKNQSI